MTEEKTILYKVTLPVSVELRSTIDNSLLVTQPRTVSYGLTKTTIEQVSRSAQADRQGYERAMLDHLQRVMTTQIMRDGKGKRFQEYVRTSHKHVWVRVVLNGEITYTRSTP